MAGSVQRTSQFQEADLTGIQLRVSAYERTASWIVSLLLLVTFMVIVLLVLVFTQRLVSRPPAVEVELLEELSGRGDHPIGTEMDMLEPGVDDFPQLTEPSFDQLVKNLEGLLAADEASFDATGWESASGQGAGDRRQAGPLGDSGILPRSERWDIAYTATTLQTYSRQLDYFDIELGVVGGGTPGIDYVRGFTNSPQTRHEEHSEKEQRLYFTWRSGQLQQFDRQLVQRSGVPVAGRRVVQFYSPEVENRLALLERDELAGRPLEQVRKTRFGVRGSGDGFEYYVMSIEMR